MKGCAKNEPIDCVLSDWTDGECTATCGGGQLTRNRSILTPNKFGGNACNGTLSQTVPCATTSCAKQPPVDCEWNIWSDWSVCDKCGGQRKRSRTIALMPKHYGKPCHFENSEETAACPRKCHDAIYCLWSDWTTTDCSAKCGPGFKLRERTLKSVSESELSAQTAQRLFNAGTAPVAGNRLRDMAVSFATGSLMTFLVLAVTIRTFRSPSARSYGHADSSEVDQLMLNMETPGARSAANLVAPE